MYTRRHYADILEVLADMYRQEYNDPDGNTALRLDTITDIVGKLSSHFMADNSLFNADRFMTYWRKLTTPNT
jgi:hypothetical protein